MTSSPDLSSINNLFQTLSAPSRLEILRVLAAEEACVCHLEAALGLRQAYISQQLMALRANGLVTDRREGRYIYYRLADPQLFELIRLAARLSGFGEISLPEPRLPVGVCACPHCNFISISELE